MDSETFSSVTIYDALIVGGGINGCGIARDLAGRGIKTCLLERGDLGSETSSGSTKLIHGGLRYLEHYDFGLVRKALKEREIILRSAPHIVWPLRFILPHYPEMRPAWLLRFGLTLYDIIGGSRSLSKTSTINLGSDNKGLVLKENVRKAFIYSDCWVDDSRLVLINAIAARRLGATILPRCEMASCVWDGKQWIVNAKEASGSINKIHAKVVINAAGPFVNDVAVGMGMPNQVPKLRRIQGTHIVVHKLFEHQLCFTLQQRDGRIIFAIPYEEEFTLVGTTDLELGDDTKVAAPTGEEIDYLLDAINHNFKKQTTKRDIVWTFAGIRPLIPSLSSKAQKASRDSTFIVGNEPNGGRFVHVLGGKLTTYRELSEKVSDSVVRILGYGCNAWTKSAVLPGGDISIQDKTNWIQEMTEKYNFLPVSCLRRIMRLYGSDIKSVLDKVNRVEDMGTHLGLGLYGREVDYLCSHEWARTAEDILWRRTKLGLRDQTGTLNRALARYLKSKEII